MKFDNNKAKEKMIDKIEKINFKNLDGYDHWDEGSYGIQVFRITNDNYTNCAKGKILLERYEMVAIAKYVMENFPEMVVR